MTSFKQDIVVIIVSIVIINLIMFYFGAPKWASFGFAVTIGLLSVIQFRSLDD